MGNILSNNRGWRRAVGTMGLTFAIFFFASIFPGFADSLESWTWRNPRPQGANLYAITYANGRYVAAGTRILESADANSWTVSPRMSEIRGIVHGAGIYVAVAYGTVLSSPDNAAWSTRVSGLGSPVNAVAFGNGKFVAVGGSGSTQVRLTSSDGVSWTPTIETGYALNGVTFASGIFVAVGNNGTILTSPDGTTWTAQVSGGTPSLLAVYYGNNTFIAVGAAGSYSGSILTSPDGITWTIRSTVNTSGPLRGICYASGRFIAVGGTFYNLVASSPDGITWQSSNIGGSVQLNAVTYGGANFVAVGDGGGIQVSANGTNWVSKQSGSKIIIQDITYANDMFAAVGWTDTLLTSSNGAEWTVKDSSTNYYLKAITYGQGKFVAAGAYINTPVNVFMTSTNGVDWIRRTNQFSTSSVTMNTIAYGNGLFVAGSYNGVYVTSPDAINWTLRTNGLGSHFKSLIYTNGLFVAACSYGQIATSTDGIGWISRATGVNQHLNGVTYANNTFVAVGDTCIVLTSTNGTSWSRRNFTTDSYPFYHVLYSGGKFLVTSHYGFCWVSPDGTNWTRRSFNDVAGFRKMVEGRGTLVAVNDSNAIMQSGYVRPQLTAQKSPIGFNLTVSGGITTNGAAVVYQVLKSSDFNSWPPLVTLTNSTGTIAYEDTAATNSRGFYRVIQQ